MIIYKDFFERRDEFSGSTAIVYSTLISYSLWKMGADAFDSKGDFDIIRVEEYMNTDYEYYGGDYIELQYFSCKTLAKTLNMSLRNVQYSVKFLRDEGYIMIGDDGNEYIKAERSVLRCGYIKIEPVKDLKGWQLVFYSILKERASYYNGSIDTWAERLAEIFKTTKENVHSLIRELKAKGYVKRLRNGRLLIITKNGETKATPPSQDKKSFRKDSLRMQI